MLDRDYTEIVGVIHIHSNYSDGSKSIEDIAQIGEHAGLDFLLFADHNTLSPLHDGHQRYHGKTAVIIGYEIEDDNDENHFLAFGLKDTLNFGLTPDEYVKQVREKGGVGIVAHPDEVRNAIPKYPAYPWNRWDIEDFHGIEIWNHMSAWMEKLKRMNMLKMAIMPRRSLRGPTARILKKWDELAMTRPVAGIGSADVHAHAYRKGVIRLTIFPYKVQFKSIRTHLLLDKPLSDDIDIAKNQILNAIKNCRIFISHYRWGDATGFIFFARDDNSEYLIGETVKLSDNTTLVMHSPEIADIKLIHNGRSIMSQTGSKFRMEVLEPGVYRVELRINDRGWIYSNHIRVI